MKNSYEQINTEDIGLRKVSLGMRILLICLIIIFTINPIYKFVPDFISCTCWEPFTYRHINLPINMHPCDVVLYHITF